MFVPEVDSYLTVQLPNEVCRTLVRAVPDEDTAIVEIMGATVSKTHTWKKGDFVTCLRRQGLTGEYWMAMDKDEEYRLRKLEEIRAANARKVAEDNQSQHKGNGGRRAPAKASGGGGAQQRKKASKNG